MGELSDLLTTYVPTEFNQLEFWKLIGLVFACCLGISLVGRLVLGKRSGLNRTLSSVIGILWLYVLGAVLYSMRHQLYFLLSSLPFIQVAEDYVVIFPTQTAAFSSLCAQVLRMTILVFLVNLLNSWLPEGKTIFTWYLLQFTAVAAGLVLQYAVFWLFDTYLPASLLGYAPIIVVVLLLSSILLGILKLIIGLFLAAVNPLIAGLYAFFFVNKTGKIVSSSAFTAVLLTGLVYGLNAWGYTLISITTSALLAFIPAGIGLLILWYVVRKVL